MLRPIDESRDVGASSQMNHSEEITTAKRTLRKEKIGWRKSLPAEEAREKSKAIEATVEKLPEYANAKTILFYVSAKENEVDTHSLMRKALAKGIRVLVPVTDFDRTELIVSEMKDMEELVPARFGLLEPRGVAVRPVDPHEADVVIVPGIAFDRECRRIGFGGGYYDRLLADTSIVTIALSYEGQMVECVPTDLHDMPVDIIVTETHTYRANKPKI